MLYRRHQTVSIGPRQSRLGRLEPCQTSCRAICHAYLQVETARTCRENKFGFISCPPGLCRRFETVEGVSEIDHGNLVLVLRAICVVH